MDTTWNEPEAELVRGTLPTVPRPAAWAVRAHGEATLRPRPPDIPSKQDASALELTSSDQPIRCWPFTLRGRLPPSKSGHTDLHQLPVRPPSRPRDWPRAASCQGVPSCALGPCLPGENSDRPQLLPRPPVTRINLQTGGKGQGWLGGAVGRGLSLASMWGVRGQRLPPA